MTNIIIISDDICAVKQMVNTINKIKFSPTITIYSTKEFKTKLSKLSQKEKDIIYLRLLTNKFC